jgi:hypothetical protein
MSGFKLLSAATFLSASLLAASVAQAMEIRQFDKMAIADQGDYVGLLSEIGPALGFQTILICLTASTPWPAAFVPNTHLNIERLIEHGERT